VKPIAHDLDAWPFAGLNVAIAPDDSKIVVALASLHKPDNADRQKPIMNRWMSIGTIDTKSGALALIRPAAGHDETDPAIAGRDLYWVHIDVAKSVVALPAGGGTPHTVVSGIEAYAPAWSRDGKQLAYVFGQYRLADWALSQDIGIVGVDANARATTPHKVFIQGSHEDFPPDWSPDGKWIVWHSHRDPHGNPAFYDAPGATDAIYIRAAQDTHAPERNLSGELWETGWAYWSPDGTKVIYTSWDRDGEPGKYHAIVAHVDPSTGRTLKTERLQLPEGIRSPQIADWSPDGREIAIEDASGPRERTLWIASADGGAARKVISYPSETYGGVSWMPDGKALVYAALDGDHMQIYSVARDGANAKRLSDGQGNLLGPRVSRDGKWIACSRVDTTQKLLKSSW
jgi:Tol biopolymer transport system component